MKHNLHILTWFALSVLTQGLLAAPAKAPKNGSAYFENQIRPIFIEHCYDCHSEEAGKQKGGLLLDRSSGWLGGGDSGPAVVPKNVAKSLLIKAVQYHDEDFQMPPKVRLEKEQVAKLMRWVQIGAPGPRKDLGESEFSTLGDQVLLSEKAKSHWAFQPMVSSGAIDEVVGAKLKEQGMTAAKPADRRTLLRRLSYDLIGLPPTFNQVEQFVASKDPKAVEQQIDRLLASPQFGERWGRYWLDVARYADTREWQAAGLDSRYPYAYTYRDYVIRSFNEDKPYDEFLREQIAADFYTDNERAPELAALGFLTVGSRYRNNRSEIYNDRIDVVTRGVMGLTVACARCHDHKFDAVPTTDYYALYGVFASCQDVKELPEIDAGYSVSEPDRVTYEQQMSVARKKRTDHSERLAKEAMADFQEKPALYMGALYDSAISEKQTVRGLIAGKKFRETVLTPLGAKVRLLRSKRYINDAMFRPWVAAMGIDDKAFEKSFGDWLSEEAKKKRVTPTNRLVMDVLQRSPAIKSKRLFAVRYGEVLAEAIAHPDKPGATAVLAQLNDPEGVLWITPRQADGASRLLGKGRTAISKLDNAINDIDAEHPGAPARAMILEEGKLYQPVVFERGEQARKGESVDRRFLMLFGGEVFQEGSGRKELAEAIASKDNPLTARVYVNRIWMHLFGESLVASPGDFGLQMPEPVQVELLDSLAASLIENDWSTKQLIREVVMSRTYQQSSKSRVDYEERDPQNQYLWRTNVRRLDFEGMRDSMLAASGKLDLTMGGRAVDITAPPYSARRTVYAYVDRVNFDDMFATFDVPSPDQSAPERPETLVPQQALFSMNDPFTIQQAKAIAANPALRKEGIAGDERVEWMYQQLFQRAPKEFEVKAAKGFLSSAFQSLKQPPDEGWQYGYASMDVARDAVGEFTRFPFFDAQKKSYQFSKVYPHPKWKHLKLGAASGHPGGTGEVSILRWTAPYAGKFTLSGLLIHRPRDNGDGVHGRIVHSRQGELARYEVQNITVDTDLNEVTVVKGDTIDFIVHCKSGPVADAYNWQPEIRRLGMAETAPVGIKTVWLAKEDFAGPPPPPLGPLQQLAHALLMTNEFLFVD